MGQAATVCPQLPWLGWHHPVVSKWLTNYPGLRALELGSSAQNFAWMKSVLWPIPPPRSPRHRADVGAEQLTDDESTGEVRLQVAAARHPEGAECCGTV